MAKDRSMSISRREFLVRTAGAGAGLVCGSSPLWGVRALMADVAPSNRITIGCIGVGGMGSGHLRRLVGMPEVEVVAVCDVDANRLQSAIDTTGGKAEGYRDYRELLDRDDIDAVCVATPDHWHAYVTIRACEAGKDVYVEKPLSHNVVEGREMVKAARRHGRIVQVGTQQRAQSHFRHVVELVRSGRIGEVKKARCWIGPGGGGRWGPDTDPPPELDWDFWLGPAPYVPYNPNRCHFQFRYFWDYAGGLMTDWGVHLIDIVHWAMDQDAPRTIEARGTYPKGAYADTPEEMEAVFEYPDYTLYWTQLHGQHWDDAAIHGYGIKFYGTEGELFCDRTGYKLYPDDRPEEPLGPSDFQLPRVRSHWHEFLECVRTRRRPTSDVEVGHRSTVAPLLGNIALRSGRRLHWDPNAEQIIGDAEASRLLGRIPRQPYGLL